MRRSLLLRVLASTRVDVAAHVSVGYARPRFRVYQDGREIIVGGDGSFRLPPAPPGRWGLLHAVTVREEPEEPGPIERIREALRILYERRPPRDLLAFCGTCGADLRECACGYRDRLRAFGLPV